MSANNVNIPKTHWTFCKKCAKYQSHKMTHISRARILWMPRKCDIMTPSTVVTVGRVDFLEKDLNYKEDCAEA